MSVAAEPGVGCQRGADLFVVFVDEPDEVFLRGSRGTGVVSKRPDRGWLVGRGRGEEVGEERRGIKRKVKKLEEARQELKKGGRLGEGTCLEDRRALGKKEREDAEPRSKRMIFRGRRVSITRLGWLEGSGKGGGMEIEAEM